MTSLPPGPELDALVAEARYRAQDRFQPALMRLSEPRHLNPLRALPGH